MKTATLFFLILLLPIASHLYAENMEKDPLTRADPGFNFAINRSARLILTDDGRWFIHWDTKSNATLKIDDYGYSLEWDLFPRDEERRAMPDPAKYILLNR